MNDNNGMNAGLSKLEERPDSYLNGVSPKAIPIEELRRLSHVNEFKSVFYIALEWAGILASIAVCVHFWHPGLYFFAVLWIGARQHGLGILMHDSAHQRLFRNRKLDLWIVEVFLCWPIFITSLNYRRNHINHHRHVNTENDPEFSRKFNKKYDNPNDWKFPKNWPQMAVIIFKDISGFNTAYIIKGLLEFSLPHKGKLPDEPHHKYFSIARLAFYTALSVLLTYFSLWQIFLLFWIVPLVTWLPTTLRLREIGDHFAIEDDHFYNKARTIRLSLVERLLIAPHNIHYHIEHHTYPSVPFYNLPKLHQLLKQTPEYQKMAHVTNSYWGVLQECVLYQSTAKVT